MVGNDVNLSFCIWDYEDITHEDITKTLGLNPYRIYVKGKPKDPKFNRISKRNGWIYGAPYHNGDSFEEQVNKILDALEPKIPILQEYAKKYYCEFSCAVFLMNNEESTPWVHLTKRYNAFIREVDARFDLNFYRPPLDEEENEN
jgi:hypothetical protein